MMFSGAAGALLIILEATLATAAMPTLDEMFPVTEDRVYFELALSYMIAERCVGRRMYFGTHDLDDVRRAASDFTTGWPEDVKDKVWITMLDEAESTPALPVTPGDCERQFDVLQRVLEVKLHGLDNPVPGVRRPF